MSFHGSHNAFSRRTAGALQHEDFDAFNQQHQDDAERLATGLRSSLGVSGMSAGQVERVVARTLEMLMDTAQRSYRAGYRDGKALMIQASAWNGGGR